MIKSILETIFLGIVQGLTEFLPVSSSGHLVLFQRLLGMPSTGLLLEILLHVGTLFAVLVVFWQDFWEMLRHPLRSQTLRLLVVATLPAVVVTLIAGDKLDSIFSGWFLGYSFLITSVLLLASDWLAARRAPAHQRRSAHVRDMSYAQATAMGVMQAFAIIPGVSRSGSTIVGGLAAGVSRRTAAKFSFLMSAIATVGSLVFKLKDFIELGSGAFSGGWVTAGLGMVAAAISGYVAIRWMMSLIQRVSLKWFGLYTALLGVIVLLDQYVFGIFF